MLVLATQGSAIQAGGSTGNIKRKWSFEDSKSGTEKLFLKDVMPSAWQGNILSILVCSACDENVAYGSGGSFTIYASEWVLPSLYVSDKFTVKEAGLFIIT